MFFMSWSARRLLQKKSTVAKMDAKDARRCDPERLRRGEWLIEQRATATSPGHAREKIWAVTLKIAGQERLEERVLRVVQHLAATMQDHAGWYVEDIDATGSVGSEATHRLNAAQNIRLTTSQLSEILGEDGQVIELDAALQREGREVLRIIVRDGASADVLGTGELPGTVVLGEHIEVDPELFLWGPR